MRFFNIEKGLELPQTFNIMHDALDELYAKRQEDFQKSNPLLQIYKTYHLDRFQKSFGSSTGFNQAFEQTSDYASYPGFTNGDGFKFTIGYKAFNGKLVFTWQMLLEADPTGISETIKDFQVAWHRQIVEYGIFTLSAFFGNKIYDPVSKTHIKLTSADTVDGDTMGDVKNPIFTNAHTIVRREGMSDAAFNAAKQSNKFYINVKLDGTETAAYEKIANGLYQIETIMSKYLDDNGKRAGVEGRKKIIMTRDAHLNQAINNILAAENFSFTTGKPLLNPVKDGFDTYVTPYLDGNMEQPLPMFAVDPAVGHARGLLIVNPSYNADNKGPMMVERLGFSFTVVKEKDPEGVKYLGKQAFDFYCPSWRGVAYVFIGNPNDVYDVGDASTHWANPATFTQIIPVVNLPVMATVDSEIVPTPTLYNITVTPTANATVVAGDATAAAGSEVGLTITPAAGYHLTALMINGVGIATNATKFFMPAANVTITYTVAAD